jgi:hypothetical protein
MFITAELYTAFTYRGIPYDFTSDCLQHPSNYLTEPD